MGIYDRNDGQEGVVYILVNEALKDGIFKIGQSTRSGRARASDLNAEGKTGMPKLYRCVYEVRTVDCGRAEKLVHARLHKGRMTRQEFFKVELEEAKRVIHEVIAELESRPVEDVKPARQFTSMADARKGLDGLVSQWQRARRIKETIFCMRVAWPLFAIFVAIVYSSLRNTDSPHSFTVFMVLLVALEGVSAFSLWREGRTPRAQDALPLPHPPIPIEVAQLDGASIR
jgi:hypothetical protein